MDIRLVRGRAQRLWLWTGILVTVAVLALLAAMVFGDATRRDTSGVGAAANFGSDRGDVRPVVVEPFGELEQLKERELGRLLQVTGWAESRLRRNAVYVRTADGRRILVRFEPDPPEGALRSVYPGAAIDVRGYLQKLSRTEFGVWMDTLAVGVPRPRPGAKFGDLPDSNFARIDSLFIKDFYISVRPEGIASVRGGTPPAAGAPARAPAAPRPAPAPAAAAEEEPEEAPIEIPDEPQPEPAPPRADTVRLPR
jgi:hypothetical protein